ncbi:epithelial-stromal interaction protein 1 [Hyla sarda]|uniref:epithelial-stromal interaction protein 1 n=1 Tax=Hyla sarda TaxID=327740 RepID=UPI0024C3CBCF|nr:epithelial-stromal interaction protein 1 [Hyla sarda]
MYGQSGYGRGRNERRIQNNYQSQRNDNTGEDFRTGMEGQQRNPDPQQDTIIQQPAPQAPQESQYSSSHRVIQPDPTKREKLLSSARKEEEEYERFKESRRLGPIYLTPQKLGGQTSESEARKQQQVTQAQSKHQKMIQREEYRKKLKEEEEAKIQKMKDIQRKKAEKLEEKRQQQDMERRHRWHEDRGMRNNAFLDQLQPVHHPYNNPFGQTTKWGKDQAVKQEQTMQKMREMDSEDEWPYRAVNQDQDEDWMLQQALKDSLLTGKDQAVKQEQTMQKMREMDSEDEWPYRAVNQDEDEDWMLQQALKDSLLTHKTEEETRVQEMKKSQHKQRMLQPIQQTYKQQQKEEEEKRLKEMKEEQRRKAEVLQKCEEERTLSQEEQRRRVNNVFLDRLQRNNTSQHGYTRESNTWA